MSRLRRTSTRRGTDLRRGHDELAVDATPVFQLATAFDELGPPSVQPRPPQVRPQHALGSNNATEPIARTASAPGRVGCFFERAVRQERAFSRSRSRKPVIDHVRQRWCPVGDDLGRVTVNSHGGGEEDTRGGDTSMPWDVHVDDLACRPTAR